VNVNFIQELRQGLSFARNAGCDKAKGNYLLYLDDDSLAPAGYLKNVLSTIDIHRPDIMGGPVYPYYDSPKPRWFSDDFEIRKFAAESGFYTDCRVSGGNFVIRKDLLQKLGKFDPEYGMKGDKVGLGEERAILELYRQTTPVSEQRVFYSLESSVLHYVSPYKMTRRYMLKRHYIGGRTASRMKKKNPAGAIGKIAAFIPAQLRLFFSEMKRNGILKANYSKMLFNAALRAGNIAELFHQGLGPILRPHIRRRFSRRGRRLKNFTIKRLPDWFRSKAGIEPKKPL
jgi:glycosyltransferase involved in cell wall biosynthesis